MSRCIILSIMNHSDIRVHIKFVDAVDADDHREFKQHGAWLVLG